MRWQRAAQALIALLVIGFVVVLVVTLRKERVTPAQEPPPKRLNPANPIENPEGGQYQITDASGKPVGELAFGSHIGLPDGRAQLSGHVKFSIDRGNRHFVVESDEAIITRKDALPEHAAFKGNVRLTGTGGLELETAEATYTDADGMVTIPGALEFTKGRLQGSGIGATYDQNREVLWILDQAKIAVAPSQDGVGALDGSATKIGMARADHYIVLEGAARIEREGRVTEANLITIRLSEDDERVQMLELRDQSRIAGGQSGPQAMSATDIDLTYAEDGRTLQFAKLVENAVVQLPGEGGGAGRRIAASAIDIALGPDGTSVTNLTANERVRVDLPAEGKSPAKRICAASLLALGAPGSGLQNATFGGGVVYEENGTTCKGGPAVTRSATSLKLQIETKPGLGALEKADFRGNVIFRDAPDFKAEAAQGIYHVTGDRLELMPAEGEPGPSARVTDGRLSVQARTIEFVLSSHEMTADTRVRSTILAQTSPSTRGGEARIPPMLAQDKEVNVTSNRLQYKGTSATYSGNVRLWQGKTTINAGTIVIEEKSGNLNASETVATVFTFEEADPKTGSRTSVESKGSAEAFSYDDARRLATYTGKAQLEGSQGHLTGDRILLFMKAGQNELERTEAFGTNRSVVVREGPRIGKGNHLTYIAADDTYLMTGTPVEVVEEKQGTCTMTLGAELKFSRSSETAQVKGTTIFPHTGKTLPSCPAELKRK